MEVGVGGQQLQVQIVSQGVGVSVRDRQQVDLVGPSALEPGEGLQEPLQVASDLFRGKYGRRAHGLQESLARPVAETADVVRSTKGISVNGASYRNGRLDLDLQADNLQILDGLKQALVSSGLMRAEIQSR